MTELINNGGAEAIKGFNYQKAIAALIAIRNYRKNGFKLFVEQQEDLEVSLEGYYIFIQVKSSKLSFSKLKQTNKNQRESILFKLLSKNKPTARFKIVTPKNKFSETDKNKMSVTDSILFYNSHSLSDQNIINTLNQHLCECGIDAALANEKLNQTFIYLSDFESDYQIAINYLLGEMNNNDIVVDNNQGIISLKEFFNLFDQIAEKKHLSQDDKVFKTELITSIFKTCKAINLFYKILEKLNFPVLKQELIKKEKVKILQIYQSHRDNIINIILPFTPNPNEEETKIIEQWMCKLVTYTEISEETKLAILIEFLADKIEEV